MRRASVSVLAALALLVAVVAIGESAGGAAAPPTKKVSVTGAGCSNGLFCYKPATFAVPRGTKVVWTNNSGTIHTVTRCTKAQCSGLNGGTGKQTKFGSATVQAHKTYAFTFTMPGTYRYFCKIHGYGIMHGTVTVK